MAPVSLAFADLHFHTHYSDNRDSASIEAMVDAGERRGITVFGTGDHNHNLDGRKWRALLRETAALRRRRPSLLLLRNCEITFLMGHFLVIEPGRIDGTIDEGYRFLYREPRAIKIINHPDGVLDEWDRRIIPTAAGIEVINGAVLSHAWQRGRRPRTAFDLPSLRIYADYLTRGHAVAAMGSSDAHSLAQIGFGMTGLWLDSPPSRAGVLAAIRGLRTFACTDAGIGLRCALDAERAELRWQLDWQPRGAGAGADFTVEVYRDAELVGRSTEGSGSVPADNDGLYWVAALGEGAMAVSSPVGRGGADTLATPGPFDASIDDMTRLQLRRRARLRGLPASARPQTGGEAEVDLLTWSPQPRLVDSAGRPVPLEIVAEARERIVIDKSCAAPCFDEFFLWLRRNEIHEYVFLDVRYEKRGDLLVFEGRIAPAAMVLARTRRRTRWDLARLRRLVDGRTRFQLSVRTLFASRVRIATAGLPFPLDVEAPAGGLRSLLLSPDARPEVAAARAPAQPRPRLYQVFVAERRGRFRPPTGRSSRESQPPLAPGTPLWVRGRKGPGPRVDEAGAGAGAGPGPGGGGGRKQTFALGRLALYYSGVGRAGTLPGIREQNDAPQ